MFKSRFYSQMAVACTLLLSGFITLHVVMAQPVQQENHWLRFTQQARSVIARAEARARELNRGDVGTELLLWAMVTDENGGAARILEKLEVPRDAIRLQAEAEMAWTEPDDRPLAPDQRKLTPGAKRVLEYAAEEARRIPDADRSIGSEHLLLGLLRQSDDLPFSYTVLRKAGVTLEKARERVAEFRRG